LTRMRRLFRRIGPHKSACRKPKMAGILDF
jgi:hypothetical protein